MSRKDQIKAYVKIYGIGTLLFIVSLELLSWVGNLPHLPSVFRALQQLVNTTLPHDGSVSLARWFSGWAIGISTGMTVGLWTGRKPSARIGLEGVLMTWRAVPFVSLVPLSIRIFGLSEVGKIGLVAWVSFATTWILVHHAAKALPRSILWRAESLGSSKTRWIFKVLLPYCGQATYSAWRASLGLGLIVVAITEMTGVYESSSGFWWSEGLGYRIFRALEEARDDRLLACVVIFALIGIGVDLLFILAWHGLAISSLWWRNSKSRSRINMLDGLYNSDPSKAAELNVVELRAAYGNDTVLQNISFCIPKNETVALIGRSGVGKTTLIRALGNFVDQDLQVSGAVLVGGNEVRTINPLIGVVFQDAPVFENLTVWENVTFGSNLKTPNDFNYAYHLVKEFELTGLLYRQAHTLSGGQRQRVALATALANRPALLLLDEPFGALDAVTRNDLQTFFQKYIRGRITVLFVTHDIDESLAVSNRVIYSLSPLNLLTSNPDNFSIRTLQRNEEFLTKRNLLLEALLESKRENS
jgi:ABC-type nitrate/sulfonate/bicarbonate transport system ATPase subunit/ABC-type nitrate/sulfonate/bicarbonate transport system permease component